MLVHVHSTHRRQGQVATEPPSAMRVAFHLTVRRLASRHFWAGAGLRILAHGSTFFCGWSGIAFKVDWYS